MPCVRSGFNDAGDLVRQQLPAPQPGVAGAVTQWSYDRAGRQVSRTDARGLVATFAFNDAGEQVAESRQEPNGTTTSVATSFDVAGRRKAVTDPTGTTTWGYDHLGQVTSVASPQGTIGYAYDAAGRRTRMTLPSKPGTPGGPVEYGYDAAGRVSSVTNPGGLLAGASTFTYRLDGAVNEIVRPNGVTTRHGYDTAGRLDLLTHRTASGEVAKFAYGLDPNGNRSWQQWSLGGTTREQPVAPLGSRRSKRPA